MQSEWNENWKLEQNNNGDYGLRESCLITLAAEGESEKPGNIFLPDSAQEKPTQGFSLSLGWKEV